MINLRIENKFPPKKWKSFCISRSTFWNKKNLVPVKFSFAILNFVRQEWLISLEIFIPKHFQCGLILTIKLLESVARMVRLKFMIYTKERFYQ
jgi:hypothetical protein